MEGVCKLCSLSLPLRESHYLPKSLYRVVAKSFEPSENAPVIIDSRSGFSFTSNEQAKQYLLCSACEGLFSKHGENVVVKECYRGEGSFKLLDKLGRLAPSYRVKNKSVYIGSDVRPDIDPSAYVYFALSILWRGSTVSWKKIHNQFEGALGKKYTAEIRSYLLGDTELPKDIAVHVYVDNDSPSFTGLALPVAGKIPDPGRRGYFHRFMIPGIRFLVYVGESAKFNFTQHGDSAQIMYFDWSFTNSEYYRQIAGSAQRATEKGKLKDISA